MKTHKHVAKTSKAFGNVIKLCIKISACPTKNITFPFFSFNHLQLNSHFSKISSSIKQRVSVRSEVYNTVILQ